MHVPTTSEANLTKQMIELAIAVTSTTDLSFDEAMARVREEFGQPKTRLPAFDETDLASGTTVVAGPWILPSPESRDEDERIVRLACVVGPAFDIDFSEAAEYVATFLAPKMQYCVEESEGRSLTDDERLALLEVARCRAARGGDSCINDRDIDVLIGKAK